MNNNTITNFEEAMKNTAWTDWRAAEQAYNHYKEVLNLSDERAEAIVAQKRAEALVRVKAQEIDWAIENEKFSYGLKGFVRIINMANNIIITDNYGNTAIFNFISDEWYSHGYRKLIVEKDGHLIILHLSML